MSKRKSDTARELERLADERGYGRELRAFRKQRPKLSKAQRELIGRTLKANEPPKVKP